MPDTTSSGHAWAERRKYPRHPINIPVRCQFDPLAPEDETEESLSENLGIGGMAIRADQPLEQDRRILVMLYLPANLLRKPGAEASDETEDEFISIVVASRVAWCAPFVDGKFTIGIEFIHLEPDDQECFQAFLREYQLMGTVGKEPGPAPQS